MGKENQSVDSVDNFIPQQQSVTEFNCLAKNKKLNRRKIVKGRPDMFALIKKRKFLAVLTEQRPALRSKNGFSNPSILNSVKEIMNKNNLLKFITTKNSKRIQTNFYENFMSEELEDSLQGGRSRNRLRRSSAVVLKDMEKTNYLSGLRENQIKNGQLRPS